MSESPIPPTPPPPQPKSEAAPAPSTEAGEPKEAAPTTEASSPKKEEGAPAAKAPASKEATPSAPPKEPKAEVVGASHRAGKERSKEAKVENATLGTYIQSLYDAVAHSFARPSVLGLLILEAAFWSIGAMFLMMLVFHADRVLQLQGHDAMRFVGRAMECAAIGLIGGAFAMSKVCRNVTPIFCYAPALMLTAYGLNGVLHSTAVAGWSHPAMFALGLGAGLFVGRIAADLKAAVDPEIHDRLLALKTLVRGAAVFGMLIAESTLSDAEFAIAISWVPSLLYFSVPLVFALSWIVDISIHTRNDVAEIREFPGPIHRLGYRALRGMARTIFKPLFRYEPIDARNVPESGGVVIAANHGSFLDPILLSCGTDRLIQYVIYTSYYRSLAHPLFRFLRCIPVDEHDQLGALRTGVRSLKLGACIGIFPEGEVSADGKLHPPLRGALFLAQRSGASVVSAALKGDYQALPRGAWIPHAVKVTPIFGKPFAVGKDLSKKDTEALTDTLMADLAQKLEMEPPPKIEENVDEVDEKEKPNVEDKSKWENQNATQTSR